MTSWECLKPSKTRLMHEMNRGRKMEKMDPKVDGATPDIVEQKVEQLKAR